MELAVMKIILVAISLVFIVGCTTSTKSDKKPVSYGGNERVGLVFIQK